MTVNYTYDDSNWKDKLTSYGTLPITYDAIGNPLTYSGSTYTWTMGRQLSTIDKTGLDIDYKYNDARIRIQNKVNTVTTNYHLVGDKVTYESDGTHAIYYTYVAQDKLECCENIRDPRCIICIHQGKRVHFVSHHPFQFISK